MILGTIMLVLVVGIAFFHYIQGIFSSMISATLALIAAVIAISYHEPVAESLLAGVMPNYAHAVALVALFAVLYVFMRLLTDRLVPGNIRLPVMVDKIGAGAFGFVAGVLGAGVLALAAQLLPMGPNVGGYSRFDLKDREVNSVKVPGKYQRQDLLVHDELQTDTLDPSRASALFPIPVDTMVLGITSCLSTGSAAGDRPLHSVHPSFPDEQFAFRLGPARGSDVIIPKPNSPGITVTQVFSDPNVLVNASDFEDKVIRGSNPPVVPTDTGLVPLVFRAVVEPSSSGSSVFSMSTVQLVLGNSKTGDYKLYFPIGTLQRSVSVRLTRPDDILVVDGRNPVDYVFMVDEEFLPLNQDKRVLPDVATLQARRGARVSMAGAEVGNTIPTDSKVGVIEKQRVND